ncbi:MAG: ABC transporter substrate-binding protein [Oscillospiraceae bacterium]|nr:ABC transporter substrate-binding protein [Oscillospiraceae bacterium]
MKKIIAIIMSALMMAVAFAGCQGSDKSSDSNTKKVAIIQQVENGAFNDMRQGIIDRLKEKDYISGEDDVEYQCADGDETNLNTICQSVANGEYDAAFTIATPATQGMVNQESEIPVFFCAVSAPVPAGVLSSMEKPDLNATGTSNAIPVDEIFGLAKTMTPDVKNFGLLYSSKTDSAVNTVEQAKKYLDGEKIAYTEGAVVEDNEITTTVESLCKKCDAIFIPNDAVMQAAMGTITEIARENKTPVYGSSATMVDSGCLATKAIDDIGIGKKTADMAIEYFEGKSVEEIPAIVVPYDYVTVNTDDAKAIGVDLDKIDFGTEEVKKVADAQK